MPNDSAIADRVLASYFLIMEDSNGRILYTSLTLF
jgi:hypothetical protein